MNIDLVLWIFAFVLFAIAAVLGPERHPLVGHLVPAGLACAALTFIV